MTIQPSGTISISDVSSAIGQASTFSTDLAFLNNLIVAAQRPATPTMTAFYSKAFFQNTTQGNCNNGNCTANCNCGNINCTNCLISGGVGAANCDGQQWLQSNCNCACSYNCTTATTSYNCNCACNCSKIICAKLYEFGYMDKSIWAADQEYGRWLRKNDKPVYRGYIRWARIITAWMDGKGPAFMVWIKDPVARAAAQKEVMTKMAVKIGSPWSEHMAYLMGVKKQDNFMGRILMSIGQPISRLVDKYPRVRKQNRKHGLVTVSTIWACLYLSYYSALLCKQVRSLVVPKKITSLKEGRA